MPKPLQKNNSEPSLNTKGKKKMSAYVKYSSMAIQMGLIITLSSLGGMKLDQYLKTSFPFFTLSFSMVSVGVAVYLAIKDIINYNS